MEWTFEEKNGAVTVREDGHKAVCQAIRSPDGGGLYKAWLTGEGGGRVLLGTLIPEGGALRLRRIMEIAALKRAGAWPPTGGEILMAYEFEREVTPSNWCWTDCPERMMGQKALARALGGVRRCLLHRDSDGFSLAFPYSPRSPFPIPTHFCLSRVEKMEGRWYTLFRFSRLGKPELSGEEPMGRDKG